MLILLASLLLQQQPVGMDRLGSVRFPTSCSSSVQPRFNRAVALLHSFAFAPAVEEFNAVLQRDPNCAMASWGLALTAWGNPFAAGIKPPAQLARGLAAVERARAAAAPTARERGYIEAVARLYERTDSLPQPVRLAAYRDAMAELVAREPADTEAAIFHALALAVSADPGDQSYASLRAAGATLERLFAALPDHPGLAHYIIHAYDVPPLASKSLPAAQRYSHIAPGSSHALHMPSHTYTRVGAWQESITTNVAAGEAARREGSIAELLHAHDYRAYAYLQLGQDRAVQAILGELPELATRMDPSALGTGATPAAGYFALAAIPARYALERGAWADAARLEPRQSPTPFADAVTWFARGLGAARTGDTASARQAVGELARLSALLAGRRELYWSEQVEIQRRGALAWLDFAAGRQGAALAGMREAAAREAATEKNAVTPGPIAPARELLGEMLLAAGQPAEALQAFEASLTHEPNRFRSIAGAAKAANASGDQAAARKYSEQLLKLGARADQPMRRELVEAARLARPRPEEGPRRP